MKAHVYSKCGKSQMTSCGFVPVFSGGETLFHQAGGAIHFAWCTEKKIVPKEVISEAANERIEEIEEKELRTVYGKERAAITEAIAQEKAAQAFSTKKIMRGYYDNALESFVFDTTQEGACDAILSTFRKALGSLPIDGFSEGFHVSSVFHRMVTGANFDSLPLYLNGSAQVSDSENHSSITFRNEDLFSEDVSALFDDRVVKSLALTHQEMGCFTLDDSLTVKGFKFSDMARDRLDDGAGEAEDKNAELEASLVLMTGEFRKLLSSIVSLFVEDSSVRFAQSDQNIEKVKRWRKANGLVSSFQLQRIYKITDLDAEQVQNKLPPLKAGKESKDDEEESEAA